MSDPSRRQFLGAAAAAAALPASAGLAEADEGSSSAPAPEEEMPAAPQTMTDVLASHTVVGEKNHDGCEIETFGAADWNGAEWFPLVHVTIKSHLGEFTVSLHGDQCVQFVEQVQAACEEAMADVERQVAHE